MHHIHRLIRQRNQEMEKYVIFGDMFLVRKTHPTVYVNLEI